MQPERFHFGVFEFDAATGELRRDGVRVPLQSQPGRVLGYLIRHAGQIVSREELSRTVWSGDTFVNFDGGLNFCISQIRAALRDRAVQPIYIRTIPKAGYEFIAPVELISDYPLTAIKVPPVRSLRATRKTFMVAVVIGLIATLALIAAHWLRSGQPSKLPPIVAVLRFDNETGNPGALEFSDGLTDNTVEQLTSSSHGRYRVIGNAQILRRPREERDLGAIASSLHASYVVLGQVQTNHGKIRILAHLIRFPEQTHIWVARMDCALDDPLRLESEAAQEIGNEFSSRLATDLPPRLRLARK